MDSSEQQTQASGRKKNRMELFLEACEMYYSYANNFSEIDDIYEQTSELSKMRASILMGYPEFKSDSRYKDIEEQSSEELIGKVLNERDATRNKSSNLKGKTPGETTTNDEPEL